MRRILLAFMSTLSAVVLLFGYRTSTAHPAASAATTVATAGAGTGSSTATTAPVPQSSSAPASPSPTSTGTTSTAATRTVTGQTAQTRWGPVQVQVTVSGSKIIAVTALQVPDGNPRDVEINDTAVPVLTKETLQAQSAHIDSVSGATYTSEGYLTSLQSALDKAGL